MNDAFRLGTFSASGGAPFPGMVVDERVVALQDLGAPLAACATMLDVLENWERNFEALRRVSGTVRPEQLRPLSELRVHAPVPNPGTVYCSGANYKKHVVDLIVAHQEQAETQGMTLEQKRAWAMKLMDDRAASGTQVAAR